MFAGNFIILIMVTFRLPIHPNKKTFILRRTIMVKNVGGSDKIIRIIAGIVLLALVFVGPKTAWGWIGLLPLLTGLFNFCPIYYPLKLSTAKKSE
jgi:hypothetical protein